ncbi:MAG: hypothetical protein ACRC9K_12120 [Afipia sp.]
MKISMDPMAKLRAAAAERTNSHINAMAVSDAHRDMAHRRKREIARDICDGKAGNEAFSAEAQLRGVPVLDFARSIKDRPDIIDERELHRQRTLLAIDAAATPADIERILQQAGIPPSKPGF